MYGDPMHLNSHALEVTSVAHTYNLLKYQKYCYQTIGIKFEVKTTYKDTLKGEMNAHKHQATTCMHVESTSMFTSRQIKIHMTAIKT
jgi:hypothetical protein